MANGQQVAEENVAAFMAWSSSKLDDDFREYVHRGRLKRSEIAAECGFGKSALVQNPAIRAALEALEEALRRRGVLPPASTGDEPPAEPLAVRDKEAKQRRQDAQRLNSLEQENAALRAELTKAKAMLERYKLLAQFVDETGRMPR
ncbi:VPA1267 family protein [Metapseudomonas resinovorans]|uniref:VPA1267 family protein n=1 Tax=Metapseudomonas resinovorans TaxID=53412 RepID=UPI00040D3FB5|nr:VPA1267 family protein [Pseudomonas resinovorans]